VTSPGISHSIHVAVVRLVDPFIGGAEIGHEGSVPGDADSVVFWAYMINVAWVLLGFACFVATATAVAVAVAVLVSDGAGDITFNVGAGAVFFCLAGCANTLYRRYVILPEARRRAQRGEHEASEGALHRSLPPNSSVFAQAAVGILAAVITAVNL